MRGAKLLQVALRWGWSGYVWLLLAGAALWVAAVAGSWVLEQVR